MSIQTDELFRQVQNNLKKQAEYSKEFREELDYLYFFYERKLMGFATKEEYKQLISKRFEDVVYSQYFHGYYLMKVLLNDKETQLTETVWELSKGFVRNEIPKFMDEVFKDEQVDWTVTEISHSFGIDLLEHLETAYSVFKQIRVDLANYGAYKAFIEEERYKPVEQNEIAEKLLGNPFDLNFLSPQVYMQAQFTTEEHEIWDLYTWSSFRQGLWVGSVHYSKLPMKDDDLHLLEINLSNTLANYEKLDIANLLHSKLPESIRNVVQSRLYHTEDYEVLVGTSS